MGTRDPRIDAYIEKSADFAKPILKHIRTVVHETCPDAEETMRLPAAAASAATEPPQDELEDTLSGLEPAPAVDTAVVSAEDVTAGKPDPQVFLAAAAKLQIAPSACVVVEDAAAGVEAAKRAGMDSVT